MVVVRDGEAETLSLSEGMSVLIYMESCMRSCMRDGTIRYFPRDRELCRHMVGRRVVRDGEVERAAVPLYEGSRAHYHWQLS